MELGPILQQRVTATPQMIMANTLLHLSSVELEQAVSQELAENPALEMRQVQRCPRCGRPLSSGRCRWCDENERWAETAESVYPENGAPAKDTNDGVSRLLSSTTLAEHVLRQARVSLPPQDLPIAGWIVENLDDRGFLSCEIDQAASACGVDRARVKKVISAIQQLDPVGVASRDARECLLIQIEHLHSEQAPVHPLAERLVAEQWEPLSRRSFDEIARALETTTGEIEAALRFIRDNLNPFPAHADWADPHESPPEADAVYPLPDVIIHQSTDPAEGGYHIELPGAQLYRLHISASYREALRSLKADGRSSATKDWEAWNACYDKARLFIKSVEQRWRTLERLAHHLVDHQRDFLDRGERHIKPLTRAQVAEWMEVHESTISRAVAGKFAQLPSGRIVPLAKFFDDAAPIKHTIKELVAQENKPLSDREIAEKLAQRGYPIARRTVTKYRNALHILPSSLR